MPKNNLQGFRFNRHECMITKKGWGLFFALLLWLLPSPVVAAQGWYWGSPVAPGYDRSSVVEVNGIVLQISLSSRGGGRSSLRMESSGETLTVTLGPGWYLRQKNAEFHVGDRLSVKGSKMKTREGKTYLIAAKIKNLRTGHVLELRDEAGRPLWASGQRNSSDDNFHEKKP